MRPIDADEVEKKIQEAQATLESDNDLIWGRNRDRWKGLTWARRIVIDAQTVEAEPVIYCYQCKFKNGDGTCGKFSTGEKEFHTMMHDFCVWGKSKESEGSVQ